MDLAARALIIQPAPQSDLLVDVLAQVLDVFALHHIKGVSSKLGVILQIYSYDRSSTACL